MKYASFSERVFALIIDAILLGLLETILPFGLIYHKVLDPSFQHAFIETLANFEAIILAPIYFVGFRFWNRGQTLGKKALGLRTVTDDGKKLSLFESILDCLGYYILPLDLLIGALISSKHQRLTQACAGTIVIKEES